MSHKNNRKNQPVMRCRDKGSATFLALFMLALLGFIGATVLMNVTRLYNGNEKVQGWQESLQAAEAGADIALTNVRWTINGASASPTPITAFSPSAAPTAAPSSGIWYKNTTDPNNTVYTYITPTMNQAGEGTIQTWAVVTVDAPTQLNAADPPGLKDDKGNQWYRIRSTGHAKLSGLARVSNDILSDPNARNSNALRKFNLRTDRSSSSHAAVAAPEATRTIEQIIKPKMLAAALLAKTTLDINGRQTIDSYDSSDPAKSTNGKYDPAKRQSNGNVASNGSSSTALTSESGRRIYGSASTNGGTFTDPNKSIQSPGTIDNGVSYPLPIIPTPTWGSSGQPSINPAVTTVAKKGGETITIDPDPANNYYKLAKIITPLTVALGSGVTQGTLNVWLTGDLTTAGSIIIPKGATLKIWQSGGGSFHPGQNGSNVLGIDNQNMDPSTFILYSTGTDAGSGGGGGIDLHAGDGYMNFYGTVYAPYRQIILKYAGNTDYDLNAGFYGSFVGNIITANGSVHYDEAGQIPVVVDYLRASYVEDAR